MSNQQQFEDILKATLVSKAEKVSLSDAIFENIKNEIELNRSRKKIMLKDKFLLLDYKKSIAAALFSTFIITGSVLAVSPSLRVSAAETLSKFANGYLSMKSYIEAPSKEDLKNDLGYEAKIPASLPGGYKLIDCSIAGHVDGSQTEKMYDKKEAGAIYSKDMLSKKGLTLSASNSASNSPIFKNAKTVTIGNTTAYWAEYTTLVLPHDTLNKMSQEEKDEIDKDVQDGKKILITVGSKIGKTLKGEEKITHSLKWVQDGITYELTDTNNELSYEELTKMVESIINSK